MPIVKESEVEAIIHKDIHKKACYWFDKFNIKS